MIIESPDLRTSEGNKRDWLEYLDDDKELKYVKLIIRQKKS